MVKIKETRERVDVVVTIHMRNKEGQLKTDYKEYRDWMSAVRFIEDFNEPAKWTLERIVVDKDIKLW